MTKVGCRLQFLNVNLHGILHGAEHLSVHIIEQGYASKLDAPEGGGAISLEYDSQVTVDLSDGKAYLSYANPGKSTQDIVLRIEIQDTAVVQSGTIRPGNQVSDVMTNISESLSQSQSA